MNILQIGDNDLIGNKFNGHNLHLYLKELGHEASHLVMKKESNDVSTHCYRQYRQNDCFTKNIFYDPLFINCDLIHLHLVHNTPIDLHYLRLMSRLKPIVWTVHDPWLLTGHCIYPFDCLRWQLTCGDCPSLDVPFKIDQDITALNLALKQMALDELPISYIVASHWMQNLLKSSSFFNDKKICHVPFGIDHTIFCPASKEKARAELGIQKEDIVLMFRSDASPFKGLDLIREALLNLKSNKPVTILAVGQNGLLGSLGDRFNIYEFGWLKNDYQLAKLYQACDLFLMPSRQEAFGMMAIEAMSCGRLVLAIPNTSLQDVINAPECGVVAEESSFAQALQQLIDDPVDVCRRGELSLLFAQQNYVKDIYMDRLLSVYADALNSHVLDDNAAYVLQQLKKYPLTQKFLSAEIKVRSTFGELSSFEMKLIEGVRRWKMVPRVNVIGQRIKKMLLR